MEKKVYRKVKLGKAKDYRRDAKLYTYAHIVYKNTDILLNLYGVNTTSLIAGLGIAGVALAFGLQEALKDIVSGIGIIMDNYFVVGDVVDYNGFT